MGSKISGKTFRIFCTDHHRTAIGENERAGGASRLCAELQRTARSLRPAKAWNPPQNRIHVDAQATCHFAQEFTNSLGFFLEIDFRGCRIHGDDVPCLCKFEQARQPLLDDLL
jgi:hypothetical protein